MKAKLLFGLFSLLLIIGISCKNELHEQLEINASSDLRQFRSSTPSPEDALLEIESLLLYLASFEDFRNAVISEIREKFDGESNVLIKNLTRLVFEDEEITSYLNEISDLLAAFDDVEGERIFPQIYIPFFDELSESDLLGTQSIQTVIYLSSIETEAEDYVPSGKELVEGQIITVEGISEAVAEGREIWVISINERVDKNGELDPSIRAPIPPPAPIVGLQMNFLTVREHRESWLAGGSEIHISAARTWRDGGPNINTALYNFLGVTAVEDRTCDPINVVVPQAGYLQPSIFDPTNPQYYKGSKIRNFSRSEVKDNEKIYVHCALVDQWDMDFSVFDDRPNVIGYTIFEFDTWPASTKTSNFYLDNGICGKVRYRSSNSRYLYGRWIGSNDPNSLQPHANTFYYNQPPFETYLEEVL